ncbi:MAG TPA: hypothetical protein VN633_20130 [Bryobacteraceae bacterium]|nr:hypothetical protein [Bryobacteraceae bacterium]
MFAIERHHPEGMARGDVPIAHVLTDHRCILRFHQPVIVAAVLPRLGLLCQQLVQ